MMGETRGRMAEMKREGGSLDGKEVRQGGGEEREFPNYSSKQSKSMSPVICILYLCTCQLFTKIVSFVCFIHSRGFGTSIALYYISLLIGFGKYRYRYR